jgi:hypothetical protein
MNDDDACGCKCQPCRFDDVHTCNKLECLYTAYRKKRHESERRSEAKRPAQAVETVDLLRGELRLQFGKVRDEHSRHRLIEWARFVEETSELEREVRDAKRRERMEELFG